MKQLEDQVLALSLTERRAFTRWLDEHRDEIEQPSVLVRAQENEVRQRLAEMDTDPAICIPFEEADVKQMFKEIMDERAAKTPLIRADLSEAINWYEDQQPGLGTGICRRVSFALSAACSQLTTLFFPLCRRAPAES